MAAMLKIVTREHKCQTHGDTETHENPFYDLSVDYKLLFYSQSLLMSGHVKSFTHALSS